MIKELGKKITKSNLVSVFLLLLILFLIFFSQYSQKTEIRMDAEPENINIEEQKLYSKDEPMVSAREMENQEEAKSEEADAQAKEEGIEKEVRRDDLVLGIIADAHSGQENGFSRLSSSSWALKNYFASDAVVDLGDLIESRFHYKSIKKNAAIEDYKKASYFISRYFPVYHVIGNHEVLSLSKADIQNLTGRGNYFSVKVKGYNIIILDSNYNEREKNIDAKHADDFIYDGTLPKKQVSWLKSQLKNNAKNIIFIHHPLNELTNKGEIRDAVEDNKGRIIAIFNGHQHPKVLQTYSFGGVKAYEIPSGFYQKTYTVVKINGSQMSVLVRKVN